MAANDLNYMDNFYSQKLQYIAGEFNKLYDFAKPLLLNDHIALSNRPLFSKVEKTSVIVVGGGSTAANITKEQLDEYDFVFSMNHFYRHPVLKDYPVDIVMISPEVNRSDFAQQYLFRFKPLVGFEYTAKNIREAAGINRFYTRGNKFCMHTQVYTKLGYGVRMVIMACVLGANKVDFIGFDGYKSVKTESHAFEPNKSKSNFNVIHKDPERLFQTQYDEAWKYTKTCFPNTVISNVAGDNNSYHNNLKV